MVSAECLNMISGTILPQINRATQQTSVMKPREEEEEEEEEGDGG